MTAPFILELWELSNFMSQGRSLLQFHLSCSGPKGGGGLGPARGLSRTVRQLEGPGCCASGLGWNGLEDATFQGWVCVVLLRTAFQPGMRPLPDGPVHV